MSQNVSLTLQNTPDARPIIEAIAEDNPQATVANYPAMVKIDCPDRLVINAASVSERLGRAWDTQEIHLNLVTLVGNIDEDEGRFVIAWR